MSTEIKYGFLKSGEESKIIEFVLQVYDKFIAPNYSDEGNVEFKKFVDSKALSKRLSKNSFVIAAKIEADFIGMIEIRDKDHVALFFVKEQFQKMGIGKKLLKQAIDNCRKLYPILTQMTVNSSPNSVETYKKLGFVATKEEQLANGIRFTPMEKIFNN